ncbi:hypothetical protein [Gordonia sp. C13]|uniref:hypothetical protein n=1 Tax=Gordonia sp. C13 TaxID=2935078 RepID=UPI00200B278F|nr:hypothetical protein [Gordonia sp. C13]MCK8616265.1 hypothetical protein [Gordonia sp. C13]
MTDARRPEAWRGGRVIGLLFVALMTPVAVALAVSAVRARDVPTAFVTAAFSLAIIIAAVGVLRVRVLERVEPNVEFTGARTILRYDRVYDRLIRVALALATVGGVGFVVLVPSGVIDLSLTPGQKVFFPIGVAVIVAAAVYGEYARRKYGPPSITFDDQGLTHHRTASDTEIRWVDIARITAERTESRPARDVVVIESAPDSPRYMLGDAPWYTPGGAALYSMLRFYWMNAESRTELVDGSAAERLDADQFADSGR